jgi:queuine tRNA-ribosyltransferase
MGIGTPEFILEAVENGIDIFDCVFPTRTARNGLLFTRRGPLSIKQERWTLDFSPADPDCQCPTCTQYGRAYLRHLYKSNEILYSMLATYHNLYFLHHLILEIRESIEDGRFAEYKANFLRTYAQGQEG